MPEPIIPKSDPFVKMLIPPCTRLVGANAVGALDASLSEEFQYLDLLRDIIEHGEYRPDR